MKHLLSLFVMSAACLTAFTRASAQSSLKATIPFSFAVEGHLLPAGSYTIYRTPENHIQFRNWEKKESASLVVYATNDYKSEDVKLAFMKYGDQYFLHEVRGGFGPRTLTVTGMCKQEKRLRQEQALLRTQQTTLVAAK